jgi:5-dehydro-2-deoxygluconokinase
MARGPVFMLAADHRWQWEDWCDTHGVPHSRIPAAKRLALDGLLAACQQSDDARQHAAFLVDHQYGAAEVERARDAGITVGHPLERPGVFPLEWAAEPFWTLATGDFVKVLVRHRPEWEAAVQREQVAKLKTLRDWCDANRRILLLEVVVVARADEREEEFEASGRPSILARFIRDAYAAGIVPDYWKIEGTTSASAMHLVDEAVAERAVAKLLILGKGAGFELIDAWFTAASIARSAAGFAIGRSVYWGPATECLSGNLEASSAVDQIAANYLRVIASWQEPTRAPAGLSKRFEQS